MSLCLTRLWRWVWDVPPATWPLCVERGPVCVGNACLLLTAASVLFSATQGDLCAGRLLWRGEGDAHEDPGPCWGGLGERHPRPGAGGAHQGTWCHCFMMPRHSTLSRPTQHTRLWFLTSFLRLLAFESTSLQHSPKLMQHPHCHIFLFWVILPSAHGIKSVSLAHDSRSFFSACCC